MKRANGKLTGLSTECGKPTGRFAAMLSLGGARLGTKTNKDDYDSPTPRRLRLFLIMSPHSCCNLSF